MSTEAVSTKGSRPKWTPDRSLSLLVTIRDHGTFTAAKKDLGQVGNWDKIVEVMGSEPGKDALQAKWSRIRKVHVAQVLEKLQLDEDEFKDQKSIMTKFVAEYERQLENGTADTTPAAPAAQPTTPILSNSPMVVRSRPRRAAAVAATAAVAVVAAAEADAAAAANAAAVQPAPARRAVTTTATTQPEPARPVSRAVSTGVFNQPAAATRLPPKAATTTATPSAPARTLFRAAPTAVTKEPTPQRHIFRGAPTAAMEEPTTQRNIFKRAAPTVAMEPTPQRPFFKAVSTVKQPEATSSMSKASADRLVAIAEAASSMVHPAAAPPIPRPEGGLVTEMEYRMGAMNGHEKGEFLASVIMAARQSVKQVPDAEREEQPDVDAVLRGLLK